VWGRDQEGSTQHQQTNQIGDPHNTHLSGVGWAFSVFRAALRPEPYTYLEPFPRSLVAGISNSNAHKEIESAASLLIAGVSLQFFLYATTCGCDYFLEQFQFQSYAPTNPSKPYRRNSVLSKGEHLYQCCQGSPKIDPSRMGLARSDTRFNAV
jgi:hypothetical protein